MLRPLLRQRSSRSRTARWLPRAVPGVLLAVAAFGLSSCILPPPPTGTTHDLSGFWTVTATCTRSCTGVYQYTEQISSMDLASGNFSGAGRTSNPDGPNWTTTGVASGDNAHQHNTWLAPATGYADSVGVISDNTQSGTWTGTDWNGNPGWAGTFVAVRANPIVGPDVKVVQYIDAFGNVPGFDCPFDLTANLPTTAVTALAACTALDISANPKPPPSTVPPFFSDLISSQEYRSLVHVPAVAINCDANGVTNTWMDQTLLRNTIGESAGYTPFRIPLQPTVYHGADTYKGTLSNLFYANNATLSTQAGNTGVVVTYLGSSRVANEERPPAFALLGYDAPFVYDVVRETINCDGTTQVSVVATNFPTTNLYLNDKLVSYNGQTTRLAEFIKSGGTTLNLPGQGKFAAGADQCVQIEAPNALSYSTNPTTCMTAITSSGATWLG
jgi:hypothetical protein